MLKREKSVEETDSIAKVIEKYSGVLKLRARKGYAMQILNRAMKYVLGYLIDYDVHVTRDYDGDPLKLVIEVYWLKRDVTKKVKEVEE